MYLFEVNVPTAGSGRASVVWCMGANSVQKCFPDEDKGRTTYCVWRGCHAPAFFSPSFLSSFCDLVLFPRPRPSFLVALPSFMSFFFLSFFFRLFEELRRSAEDGNLV